MMRFYYIGLYTGLISDDTAYEINFLRWSCKVDNTFFFPNVLDVADVPEKDIRFILSAPLSIHGTKRIQC